MPTPSHGGTEGTNWRLVAAFAGVLLFAIIATIVYTHRIVNDATHPVKNAATELKSVVNQRRIDLVSGCNRSTVRITASIMSEAAAALADDKVYKDPGQPLITRKARHLSSQVHLDAAARFASTLVDCGLAYPKKGGGESVINVKILRQISKQLEKRFGTIDPQTKTRFGKALKKYVRQQQ